MRIGICDDNEKVRRQVSDWIQRNRTDIHPADIHEFACGEALLEYLRKDEIDILLLDCMMNGLDGIQTAMKIRQSNRKMIIIALTDYSGYALYGYEANIYRYLLKSEFSRKIGAAFSGAIRRYETDAVPTISAKTTDGIVYLSIADILYVESSLRIKKYIVHTGKVYSTYGTNAEVESRLNGHGFIRPHSSFFVNCRYVLRFERDQLLLTNGATVPVSQRRRQSAFDALTLYTAEGRT